MHLWVQVFYISIYIIICMKWMNFLGQYTQLTIRLLFSHLQIWSAPNWILQIVFDKYVFFFNFNSSIFWNWYASFNWKPKACKIKINGYHEEAFAFALSYWIGRNDSLLLECHTVLAFQLRDEIKTTKEISRKTERESVIIDYDNEW